MPLPSPVRANMESRFGHDFSQVRIHHDSEAADSAEAVNARAYTTGPNVVFNQGEFNPTSSSGEQLLAHELAHVVQQSQGPVSGKPVGGGLQVSEPGDSFEVAADTMASQALSGQQVASGAAPSGAIMREAKDEEPEAALEAAPEEEEAVQREAKDEEPLEALQAAPEEEEAVQREAKDEEPLEALQAAPEEGEVVQRAAKEEAEQAPPPEPITEQEEVDLEGQPVDDTAWSAGFAMVANAVDEEDHEYDPQAIATMTGMELTKRQDWTEIRKAAGKLEMSPMEVREASPAMWAQVLREFGPFWLVENDQPDNSLVVGGMSGDGTAEKTTVTVYRTKPQKSGMVQTHSFQKIVEEFRLQEPDHPKTSIVHGQ